ncbi:hypothetical protein QR680_005530 [Steinernema hermaphroditum]|uniref:PH domain-containing protein n=1 Tax=Steinernema hermaphroditum TaxID=289476 RepID=A0AA39HTM3_9BILA|nr:hypothetical protein QR680_005530 [Steinernema hermaphroditum]
MYPVPVTSTPRHSPPSSQYSGSVARFGDFGARRFDESFISAITTGSKSHYRPTGCDAIEYDQEVQRLLRLMAVQEDQIMQACSALDHCRMQHHSNGTLQELTAHRILLLAKQRQIALQNELERLKIRRVQPNLKISDGLGGIVEVSSIKIHLNRNFCLKNTDMNSSYAFIVLLRSGENVYASQVVSVMDVGAMRVRTVRFPDNARFDGLQPGFQVELEVFALRIENRPEEQKAKEFCFLKRKAMQLFAPFTNRTRKITDKCRNDDNNIDCNEFTSCGSVTLTEKTSGLLKLDLNDARYPLEGTVEIRTSCSVFPDVPIEFEGFLSMYQVVQSIGSWSRFWAVLKRGVVKFFLYPDDESCGKEPRAYMDLEKVANELILRATPEVCPRPNTFFVDIFISSSTCHVEKTSYVLKRVLLNADTYELCETWMEAINKTMRAVRGRGI